MGIQDHLFWECQRENVTHAEGVDGYKAMKPSLKDEPAWVRVPHQRPGGPYGPGGSAAYIGKLKLPDDVDEPVTASAPASVSVSGERQTKNG
ncbi:MAG: hypothetical protein K0S79_1261 [Nitrospira sp.]|jgi:hypothetical protein|nr:hypothetical protein [Nitrospira sp.]